MISRAAHELVDAILPIRCAGCGRTGAAICAACTRDLRPSVPGPPPAGIDRFVAPYAYLGVARELVARAKYRGHHGGLTWLADAMVGAWLGAGGTTPDVVTWVPTLPGRRRARGFDHAHALARMVARGLGCRATPLLARGPGAPQTGSSIAERLEGPVVWARRTAPGWVLLVDDVSTSGASLRACGAVLRDAGARRVDALTAARTPGRVRDLRS